MQYELSYLGVQSSELFDTVIEGQNLGWTNEREIQRVEKEHEVFAFEVGQLQLRHFSIGHGSSFPIWSGFGNHGFGPLKIMPRGLVISMNGPT